MGEPMCPTIHIPMSPPIIMDDSKGAHQLVSSLPDVWQLNRGIWAEALFERPFAALHHNIAMLAIIVETKVLHNVGMG